MNCYRTSQIMHSSTPNPSWLLITLRIKSKLLIIAYRGSFPHFIQISAQSSSLCPTLLNMAQTELLTIFSKSCSPLWDSCLHLSKRQPYPSCCSHWNPGLLSSSSDLYTIHQQVLSAPPKKYFWNLPHCTSLFLLSWPMYPSFGAWNILIVS